VSKWIGIPAAIALVLGALAMFRRWLKAAEEPSAGVQPS
jgi:hypothetical protein